MTDLFDLVDGLKREVNSIGADSFPDATDDEWLGNLQDGFWEAVLDGTIASNYSETDGEVSPDLPQVLQRLVIFYAGIRIIRNQLRQLNTTFKAKAGNVEFETQLSPQILKSLFDDMVKRRNVFIQNLAEDYLISSVYVDSVVARDESIEFGDTYWIR